MLKRFQVLEEGRIPANEASNWNFEGQKRRITRKEQKRLWRNEFQTEDSWRRKGYEMLPERKCWKIEVYCPKKMEIN